MHWLNLVNVHGYTVYYSFQISGAKLFTDLQKGGQSCVLLLLLNKQLSWLSYEPS